MKRLGLTKSRNGCARCRQRRVKCDEQKPCTACHRHKVSCSLAPGHLEDSPQPLRQPHASATAHKVRKCSPSSRRTNPSSSLHSSSDSVSSASPKPRRPQHHQEHIAYGISNGRSIEPPNAQSLGILDLELMHHYTSVGYRSLLPPPSKHTVLQCDIPKAALTFQPLLHSILAYAAFHLASLQPSKCHDYQVAGAQHQIQATIGVRAALQNPLTNENCHTLYVSTVFLMIGGFTMSPSLDESSADLLPIDKLLDVFALVTGMAAVLKAAGDELRSGPFKDIFYSNGAYLGANNHEEQLDPYRLQGLINQLSWLSSALIAMSPNLENPEIKLANDAVTNLQQTITRLCETKPLPPNALLRTVLTWPATVAQEFVQLLRSKHPLALVVLSHYAIVLQLAQVNYWFLQKWPASLIHCIVKWLEGSPYAHMVVWPWSQIGMGKLLLAGKE